MDQRLLSILLFNGLEELQLERLLSQIIFQRKSFGKDALVASQGETCDRLIILTEGTVKGEMTGSTGKSLKIEEMEAPMVLATAFVFGNRNRFPVNIITTGDSKFIVIYKNELLKLFQLNEQVLQNYLSMISSKAQFLSEKLRFHSFRSLKAKLAFYLINEAGNNKSFKIKHSQSELAELFGVARPSVGRAFLQLQEEQIVDIRYKQVEITNFEKLSKLYNE